MNDHLNDAEPIHSDLDESSFKKKPQSAVDPYKAIEEDPVMAALSRYSRKKKKKSWVSLED